jgi:hypothetical protein
MGMFALVVRAKVKRFPFLCVEKCLFQAAPTTGTATTYILRKGTAYTLTANCPAGPKNKNLLVQTKSAANDVLQFAQEIYWNPDPSVTESLEKAKCTVARSADGLYSAFVPAGSFTDAGGNPNQDSKRCGETALYGKNTTRKIENGMENSD